jgi:hypothetical protein
MSVAITSITSFVGVALWLLMWSSAYAGQLSFGPLAQIAVYAAATGAVIVAAWCWHFRRRLNNAIAPSVVLGVICAVVLVIAFEASTPVRSIVATTWFPYMTQLRFGLLGAFVTWAILDALAIGFTVYLVARRNLTTRWNGPES